MIQPKTFFTLLLLTSVAIVSCKPQKATETPEPSPTAPTPAGQPFFGIEPTSTPKLLAPELLAGSNDEYNGAFSPDGREFYYTSDTPKQGFIAMTRLSSDNTWSEPTIASFSGRYSEYDPLFSPDGSKLYFSSRRPLPGTDEHGKSSVWFVEREGNGWGEPQYIHLTEKSDYYSSLTEDGAIYYNVWDTGKIYKAVQDESGYASEALSEAVNSEKGQGDPFIAPDESYLIFRGYREDSLGRGDLYISFNIDGEWTRAENLGEPINSADHEMCPSVTPDGRFFIFASDRILEPYSANPLQPLEVIQRKHQSADNGELNIYYLSANFIEDFRPE